MTGGQSTENRCRVVLVVPAVADALPKVEAALAGGDIACLILSHGDLDDATFSRQAAAIVPVAQAQGVAVLIENDTQVMGRSDADGIFVSGDLSQLRDTIARFSPKRLVGYGGIRTRHVAMEAGEEKPDFLFFGRLDGDIRPQAHPKNLVMGGWSAEVMQMSSIIMGGSALESVVEVAQTGAEFVALASAVFSHEDGPQQAVSLANKLLDEHAPLFDDDA